MRILMTGAGGKLGGELLPLLRAAGHHLRAYDLQEVAAADESIVASVGDAGSLYEACAGMDCIIHAAALHFSQPRDRWPDQPAVFEEYWQTNLASTHTCCRAAQAHGVGKLVFISSVAWYAAGPGFVTEDYPHKQPADNYYDLSKICSEEIVHTYARNFGVPAVVLRPGDFTGRPEPGFPFLLGRLRVEDVAQAAALAVDHEPAGGHAVFSILAGNPFTAADLPQLARDPLAVLERHHPGLRAHLEERNLTWQGSDRVYSIARAREQLGYRPRFTFDSYLASIGFAGI